MDEKQKIDSLCVYCGSSTAADPELLKQSADLGRLLAEDGVRMVYGGGGVGLMGACARGAYEAGGRVLGIMPEFLRAHERLFDEVETRIVTSMHERKWMMFDEADAFVALPGGLGTLEEIIELMSWRKMGLHQKPLIFFNPNGFWDPLFILFGRMVDDRLAPENVVDTWRTVTRVEDILPAARAVAEETANALKNVL